VEAVGIEPHDLLLFRQMLYQLQRAPGRD